MKQVYLTDNDVSDNLFPLTLTRSAADIRIGILTIREKWQAFLGKEIGLAEEAGELPQDIHVFAANIVPSRLFIDSLLANDGKPAGTIRWDTVKILQFPWHIFLSNDWAIREDYALITRGRKSAPIPATVQTQRNDNIFIEEGARLSHCILNASSGPVYIGKDAEIMEGSVIRGPFALCEGSVVKMGAKLYGATTVGPHCVVGGEIKNAVIFGYSNKAHDGYLGDSVIGEWCNLGAGTTNSNVKNNAGSVKVYSRVSNASIETGLNKCGLIMGDYSRAAINSCFNTGTVVGACANVFGRGLLPKYIPSFSWGADPCERYALDKAIEHIDNWKKLKNAALTESEKIRLKLIFDQN